MARFGLFSLPLVGHLNPMAALAKVLERRGHETIFFNVPELKATALARGCRFVEFGVETCPLGSLSGGFARTIRSSLKAQRSSADPPPRATMITSTPYS